MTRTKKSAALLKILVIAAILILLPIVTPNMYIMQIINMIGIYIILGIGINVLTGYTGQLSLGQAAFFGIGAYTAAPVCSLSPACWVLWSLPRSSAWCWPSPL